MHAEVTTLDGKSAEEIYAERLHNLSLSEGEIMDGRHVVLALLARCELWIEIIREKYISQFPTFSDLAKSIFQTRQNRQPFPGYLRQTPQDPEYS